MGRDEGEQRDLNYDSELWIQKKVADDNFFDFYWEATPKSPLRRRSELERRWISKRSRVTGQAQEFISNEYIDVARFDYLYGIMDTPLVSRIQEFGKKRGINEGLYNIRPTPAFDALHSQAEQFDQTDHAANVLLLTDPTQVKLHYGGFVENRVHFDNVSSDEQAGKFGLPGQLYSDSNAIPPIYLQFSRL